MKPTYAKTVDKAFDQVIGDLNQIVREILNDNSIELQYQTTAKDVRNWDSLHHIEIVVAVEKHFGIRFNFAELQRFKNVGEMCDNIAKKLAAAAQEG